MKNIYGSWCLVAGAAEGLGYAFSHVLAQRGLNLIMVDQQKDRLDSSARHLESSFGIQTNALHLDLASVDAVEVMMESIQETNCRLMIYNAAFSRIQKFMDNDPAMLGRYVQVNVLTPMQLAHAFCHLHSGKREHRKGILFMSSLAGSWGTQLLAPYGASKAFIHILAESLHHELKGEGVDVLACIAGAITTPAYLASLPQGEMKKGSAMDPHAVVEAGLRALGRRPYVITGFKNKLTYFLLTRVLPRRNSVGIMNRVVGKMYRA